MRQGAQKLSETLDEASRVGQHLIRQWRELEHQRTGLAAESVETGPHEFVGGQLRIEKTWIERNRFAALGAHRGVRDEGRRFDDEAEVVRHLLRIAQIVG